MRTFTRIIAGLVLIVAALWAFGPYEPADLEARFDPATLGSDLDEYFQNAESAVPDITPGTEKRVVWAGAKGARTPIALYYVHGFSATSEEIRPIPDRLAVELGANLVYTRLRGHGRTGEAMAEASVGAWMEDLTEGLAAAKLAGERVVILSTSTGGTLVTAAAHDPALMQDVAGLIFVSPNYGLANPVASLLTWPAARYWLPVLAGQERSFEPANEAHGTYWTTQYPSVAVMPMGALIKAVAALDPAKATTPALFHFAPNDQVVQGAASLAMAEAWGGPATVSNPTLTDQDDPQAHVIAGDIMSPGQTEPTVALMRDWIQALP